MPGVHPRIRGVHLQTIKKSWPARGSSPHTRGPQEADHFPARRKRFIPAYAGSTPVKIGATVCPQVHPRIRGVHGPVPVDGLPPGGSSPHTRGPRRLYRLFRKNGGFIPAYAGSTAQCPVCGDEDQVHPRIRGVHGPVPVDGLPPGGSSPHTRGPRRLYRLFRKNGGFIPAYAGSTAQCPVCGDEDQVHPRIRGVHRWPPGPIQAYPGSSPHTRGPPRGSWGHGPGRGFIPAYAGSTIARRSRVWTYRVHPRIRGVHINLETFTNDEGGSSPHTRGPPDEPLDFPGQSGFIPAYAGSTSSGAVHWPLPWVHPRIRGVHRKLPGKANSILGSSPHTRGPPIFRVIGTILIRFIPAYAGSTELPKISGSVS